ncbi:MAG: M4 family metallopeptidase [Phycisphaerae bacterium]|nr:M4 family metallopeptidase [Phycisphaerae bacterium]
MRSRRTAIIAIIFLSIVAFSGILQAAPGQANGSSGKSNKAASQAIEQLVGTMRAPQGVAAGQENGKSARTGYKNGYLRSLGAPADHVFPVTKVVKGNPRATAKNFIGEHGKAFGVISKSIDFAHKKSKKKNGRNYERFIQTYSNIPVFGGEMIVQLDDAGGVQFVLSDIMTDTDALDGGKVSVAPSITAEEAAFLAVDLMQAEHPNVELENSDPQLMIYQPEVIGNSGSTRLVWHTVVTSVPAYVVNEVVLIDAHTGETALRYSQIINARNREIWDVDGDDEADPVLARAEGDQPTDIVDVDDAYDFLGDTYDFYLNEHGRDSIDDAGMLMKATVRFTFANAFWTGSEMLFGLGFAVDDVTSHELTHGVTQYESNLIYMNESGAINESFSDMWGEWVDLTNTGGNDDPSVRWLMGEDVPGMGAIRDMSNPPAFGDPDSKCSPLWYDGPFDNGGVHWNSGVGNKLCYLLTDGDTFKDVEITGMGISAVADLMYECQTNLLTESSDYADFHVALTQAAINLRWTEDEQWNLEKACLVTELSKCFDPADLIRGIVPNPMEWDVEPVAVGLETIYTEAVEAQHSSGVEYYIDVETDPANFNDETYGDTSFDSGWVSERVFYRGGYAEGTDYYFRVKARNVVTEPDEEALETEWSDVAMTTAALGTDDLPPYPNPAAWKGTPRKISNSRISMEAAHGYDEFGTQVEYFFECVSTTDPAYPDPNAMSSNWQTNALYTVSGVSIGTPGNTYIFRVRIRDASQNMTGWSSEGKVILAPPSIVREVPTATYPTIQKAINASNHGDTVLVHPGVYREINIDFKGKAITVRSENPEDSTVVAATVIDCAEPEQIWIHEPRRAFLIQNGEGRDTVLAGITIKNATAFDEAEIALTATVDALGGAILMGTQTNPASPTIRNCVFVDCFAHGGYGSNGGNGPNPGNDSDGNPGSPGVDGGNAYGGAIYAYAGSSPLIKECEFTNCQAIGGNAGNGGNGSNGGGHSQGAPDGTPGWRGGDGGNAGKGGCAWGGAIYFESNCLPELYDVTISDCFVQVGEAGSGGDGGDGSDAKGDARGGHGGNGGIGGDLRAPDSSGGAVYFGDNTKVTIDGCAFENCRVVALLSGDYSGGDGGNGGGGNGGFPGGNGGHGGPAYFIPPKMTEIGGVDATGGTGGNGGGNGAAGGNGGFRLGQGGNPGGLTFTGSNRHTGIFPSNVYYMAYYWEDTMNIDNPPDDPNDHLNFAYTWEWESEIINEEVITPPADPLPGEVIVELGYTDIFDSPFSPYFGFLTTIEKWDVPVYEDPNFPGDPTLYTYDYENATLLSTTAEVESLTPTNPEQRSTGACAGANFYGEKCVIVMRDTRVSGNNSFANHGGGELYDKGCDAQFENCTFENNQTQYGQSIVELRDYQFEGMGGAIFADQPIRLSFSGCEFVENNAYSGAAIYCDFAPSDPNSQLDPVDPNYVTPRNLDLTACTFTGNQANSHFMYSYGGAVYAGNTLDPYEEFYFNYLKDDRYTNYDDYENYFLFDPVAFNDFISFIVSVYDHYHGFVFFANPITTQLWDDVQEADSILWGDKDPVYSVSVAGCTFEENLSPYGAGLCLDASFVDITDSQFTLNTGEVGVGGFVFASDLFVKDTAFDGNIGTDIPSLGNQSEADASTVETLCSGGGLYVSDSNLDMINNRFASNTVDGFAGAVFVNGPSLDWYPQNLINNLFVENSAGLQGGAMVASGASDVYVQNCDFVDNVVLDQYGVGGAMLAHDAFVEVVNSIFWSSEDFYPGAMFGSQIAVGDPLELVQDYDPDYIPYSTVFVDYSDIQGGEDDVFVGDGDGPWLWYSSNNIEDDPATEVDEADPLFVAISDPNDVTERTFYLSQVAAGQLADSPCVNSGTGTVADLAALLEFDPTTRTDHEAETDPVNMGYHYDAAGPVAEYTLQAGVYVADRFRHGELEVLTPSLTDPVQKKDDPNTATYVYTFKQGTVVELRAIPDENYRVKRWIGTDSAPFYYGQTDTVTMTGYETVQVEFELAVPKNLYVPESYDTIEDAVMASRDGDTIILAPRPAQPYLIADPEGINFGLNSDGTAKQVHLRSTDPDNPDVVAQTIINAQGSRYVSKRAFLFNNGADPNTIIEGVTIRNAFTAVIGPSYALDTGLWPWHDGTIFGIPPEPWTADNPKPSPPFRALSGMDATGDSYGGAVLCENGSSPTIRKCVFENCTVSGGIGGDGADGSPPPGLSGISGNVDSQSGGHSGKGTGDGYGGAIAVIDGSSPIISQCKFTGNRATGGWGGIPGDAGGAYGNGRYGWGGNDWAGVAWASIFYGINPEAGDGEGDGRGGAIFVDAGCKPTIADCIFEGNYARPGYVSAGGAESPGGAAYPEPFDAAAPPVAWGQQGAREGRDGILTDYGTIAGGAVFFAEETDGALIDCEFSNSSAYDVFTYNDPPVYTRGGAVHIDPNAIVKIHGCDFTENLAGALYCSTGATLTVDDCDFTNNKTYDPDADADSTFLFFPPEPTATWDNAGGITVEVDSKVPSQISGCDFTGNMTDGSGGAIRTDSDIEVTDSVFNANSAIGNGGAFYSYYPLPSPDTYTLKLDFTNCEFSENKAQGLGGAGYTKTSILNLTDCFFVQNSGQSGGAVYTVNSDFEMQGALVYGNEATGLIEGEYRPIVEEGLGGGVIAVDCKVAIADSRILNNQAHGLNSCGGGLCIAGGQTYKELNLLNCLVAGNTSDNGGGGLSCRQNVNVEMDNCTVAGNTSNNQLGGGIFVDNSSTVSLANSIVSGNAGYGIYELPAGGSTTPGGDSDAAYTLFYNNSVGDLFDAQTNQARTGKSALETMPQPGYTNVLVGDPLFADGPLDGYYLTQTSPAVDAGSMSAAVAMLGDPYPYTTDPAGMLDQGRLDLGYHYDDPSGIPYYNLTAQIQNGGGTVTPASGSYIRGAVVPLLANVNDEYFLTGWSGGTGNDNSKDPKNVVLMTRDRDILVLVRLRRTLNVGTSAEYDTLGDALDDVQDGDVIFIAPGEYTAASQYPSLTGYYELDGKQVTISGSNPDDESVVRATVFRDLNFILSNLDEHTIVEGITIEQGGTTLQNADLTIRNCVFRECRFTRATPVHIGDIPDGTDGYHPSPIVGGAMEMRNSSPQIINCIFEDNALYGGNAEDGFEGGDNHPNGGDGGWPGAAYGGAVYCGFSSNPTFIGCTFSGNEVFGGNGGNGADFVTIENVDYWGGRGGGWTYDDVVEQQTFIDYVGWDGWSYNSNTEKYSLDAARFGEYDFDTWKRWFRWADELTDWDDFVNFVPKPYDTLFESWRHSGYGGAVYCAFDSNANFVDCTFENNQSHGGLTGIGGQHPPFFLETPWPDRQLNMPTAGGAVFAMFDSDLTFDNCTFHNNTADKTTVDLPHTFQVSFGGAVAYEFNCRATFTDCDIAENDATVGGAIYGYESPTEIEVYGFDSPTTIADCNVFGNEAYIGAGVFLDDEAAVISGSRFEANQAKVPEVVVVPPDPDAPEPDPDEPVEPAATLDLTGEGAGIFAHVQDLQIRDSIFLKNRSQLSGGGLLLSGTVAETADIFNCLFVENTAKLDGAGASVNWMSRARFGNCTFADNVAVGIYDDVETGEFEVVLDPETGEPVLDDDNNPVLIPITTSVQLSPGKGGGLNVSFDSIAEVIDSIFWYNLADRGESVYLGTGPTYERPSELTISYSDVANYPSANAIYVEDGCTFNPGAGIFSQDPDFVAPSDTPAPADDVTLRFYLDQQGSPCIDKGSDFASSVGLSNYTTSIFGAIDKGKVDVGYHYQKAAVTSCRRADLILDGIIELDDLAAFASWWLGSCAGSNLWCQGADQNFDTEVDFQDYVNIAACWQETDTEPPFPDPAEWEVEPFATAETFDKIQMTAKLHHDLWFPDEYISYRFYSGLRDNPDIFYIDQDVNQDGWLTYAEIMQVPESKDEDGNVVRVYASKSGLAPSSYSLYVQAVDGKGNSTALSNSVDPVTPGEGTELPAAQWLEPPFVKTAEFAIQMEALAYEDFFDTLGITVPTLPAGYVIKYQFDYTGTASGGDGRFYDFDPVYVDSGMVEGQTYSYRVRMGLFYEPGDGTSVKIKDGDWSEEASVVASGPDLTPPDPDPAQHASGSPFQVFVASKGIYYHVVTAVAATDVSDVEYRFVNATNSSYSSGGSSDPDGLAWRNAVNVVGLTYPNGDPQVPEQYWAPRGIINASDGWYILVRDQSPNQNTTVKSQTRTIFTPAP